MPANTLRRTRLWLISFILPMILALPSPALANHIEITEERQRAIVESARKRGLERIYLDHVAIDGSALVKLVQEGFHVSISESVIQGWLDFSPFFERGLPGQVTKDIDIIDSTVQGVVLAEHIIFTRRLRFRRSVIDGLARFANVRFQGKVLFQQTTIGGGWSCFQCVFEETADFSDDPESEFFTGKPSFGSVFREGASFTFTSFLKEVRFDDATFEKGASFRSVDFPQGTVFFDGARFLGDLDLEQSHFPGNASFNRASFEGKVNLSDTSYGRLDILWADIKSKLQFDDRAYLRLIRNFDELGRADDADDALVTYRASKRDRELAKSQPHYWIDLLFDWGWGYGRKPERVIKPIVLVVLFFALVVMGVSRLPFPNALYLSATAFFRAPVFSVSFPDVRTVTLRIPWPRISRAPPRLRFEWRGIPVSVHYRYLLGAESIVGWIVFALFLASLAVKFFR